MVIGGFVLNNTAIEGLNQVSNRIKFIDINSFEAPFTLNGVTDNIIELIRSFNEKVIILGYSTGGLIAIKIAILLPDLISKMILLNATPCFLGRDNWCGVSGDDFSRLERKCEVLSLENFKQHFTILAMFPYKQTNLFMYQNQTVDKISLVTWLKILKETDLRDDLVKINIDILFIYSSKDFLIPNSNKINNPKITSCTLDDSSHAYLNQAALISAIKGFI